MSSQTALRLAVRPLRGVAILDQLGVSAPINRPRTFAPICLRCNVAGRADSGRVRLFSTAPRPPREPSEGINSTSEPAATTENAPPTSTSSPSSSSPPKDAEPESPPPRSSASSSSASATTTPPSSSPTSATPSEPSSPESDPPSSSADRSLPSFTETHRHPWSARFSTFMDNLQSRALTATQTINDLTGYSAIEAIKSRNSQLEGELSAAQGRLREARQAYKSLTSHRAATQREVTTLLARKDTWNPADLERFTTLYRLDHELEAQVAGAAAELTDAETDEARLSGELNAGILKRYHEEQIWSDRIRRQSTWGTWGLMGVNVVLFLVLQFVAEPWRRKRLVRGIAETERSVMDEVKRELAEVRAALEASGLKELATATATRQSDQVAAVPVVDGEDAASASVPDPPMIVSAGEASTKPWKEVMAEYWSDPSVLKAAILDLYSERRADLRMRDVSIIALEGAAAGATVVAAIAFALLRNSRA
ncbi:Sensitive to high expression protein 9, mitochondrial [Madurella mycetomatis]|uniref:Sensitive to high expression protein 9, mitochondrial n=1 Tax=Madurella mycetomatis TaxID=100816 RepID=A0A175WBB8_9PEZI|nr:Sensitive to high expression protein 9, mitochondrial [Madurella mycetomatis]